LKNQFGSPNFLDIPLEIQEKLKKEALSLNRIPFSENPWIDPDFSKRYTCYVDEKEIWGNGKAEVQKIIQIFPQPHLQILDLACGTGRHAYFLSEAGHSVVGVDQCFEAITRAKKRNYSRPADFFCSPVLEFQTQQRFDLILILCALALNLSTEQFQAWIHFSLNLLKPEGAILIDLPEQLPKEEAYFFLDDRPLWHEKPCWIYHCCQVDPQQRRVMDLFVSCSLEGKMLPPHTVSRQYHQIHEIQKILPSKNTIQVISPHSSSPPLHTPWILISSIQK
ncbi:MAG: class I SAM-dependent methyltransferase, partial [Planctomycetota bacterium]